MTGTKRNLAKRMLTTCLLWCGGAAAAHAQTNVAQILSIAPKTTDVAISTPKADELAQCKLDVVKGPTGGSGYLLVDGQQRPLRKFFDSDGDGRVDTWSYYRDGQEVYREVAGKSYQFRWIGQGGMKWGVGGLDAANKARITNWRMISAEEASQEAFAALASGDFERMRALLLTPEEIQSLGAPPAEAKRLATALAGAEARFKEVRAKYPKLATATYQRLEGSRVGAYPADMVGASADLLKSVGGLILFENATGEKKHDYMPAADLVLVGQAWRFVDVPGIEDTAAPGGGGSSIPPELLEVLGKIDQEAHPPQGEKAVEWNLKRVMAVQKIVDVAKAEEKEQWQKQIVDGLAAAIAAGDKTNSPALLSKWRSAFASTSATGPLTAYATYRELWANYQAKMSDVKSPNLLPKVQQEYHSELAKFVQSFPKADDAPDALLQLAMGSEFSGSEDEAKKWYQQIAKDFPTHANGPRAAGAIRRLDAVGKALELTAPMLDGSGQVLSAAALKGKAVVVYYWTTFSSQAVGDFATLGKLQAANAKDLAIVAVNLDDNAKDASEFLKKSPLTAYHVHQPGGMSSPLALQYGVFALPQTFLVGPDGAVASTRLQPSALEEEVAKVLKK